MLTESRHLFSDVHSQIGKWNVEMHVGFCFQLFYRRLAQSKCFQ